MFIYGRPRRPVSNGMDPNKITIYTDGGARGNPGPAAVGMVIGKNKYHEYIGETTNNVAEYKAVILALKKVVELFGEEAAQKKILEINVDSELLYKQDSGDYRVKDANLKVLFMEMRKMKKKFKTVNFKLVPREKNKEADKLVNEELDNLT